jgi:hypothetical protein
MIPSNFDKIISFIKQDKKFDISFLWWFTNWKIFLNDFLDIKEINQGKLSDKPWFFWNELPENPNIVDLWSILKIQVGVQTWCDNVTKKHIEKWLAREYEVWRWIFVLKENIEIRWVWLNDIRNKKDTIWKIELNLYENWSWVELTVEEKSLIKPLYWWKDLNIWKNTKTNIWLIFYNIINFVKFKNIDNLNKHFDNFKLPLINTKISPFFQKYIRISGLVVG